MKSVNAIVIGDPEYSKNRKMAKKRETLRKKGESPSLVLKGIGDDDSEVKRLT